MEIRRDRYLNRLISKKNNGLIKVITGIRRSGKSYLLFNLYFDYLISIGVPKSNIITIPLDDVDYEEFCDPHALNKYIKTKISDKSQQYYVFIDEIQLSYKIKNDDVDEKQVPEEDRDMLYTTFYDILIELMGRSNLDIYVTGSNSRMLSKDVVTNFRDRGTEIRVYPLSFEEFYSTTELEKTDALEEYLMYGGMPLAVLEKNETEKRKYLVGLNKNVYIKDIVDRYKIRDDEILDALIDSLSSAVGSLSNPHNLANAAGTLMKRKSSDHTIKQYLDYLEEAYLFISAKRYDIKGKRYFENIRKYYAMDIGLRNAKLNFRQQDKSHLMENLVFLELVRRGFNVDVGVVEVTRSNEGKKRQLQYEIDFVVNTGYEKIYIQTALNVDTEEKKKQETFSLKNSGDFFRKIVILDGNMKAWTDSDGITYIGVIPFLLEGWRL